MGNERSVETMSETFEEIEHRLLRENVRRLAFFIDKFTPKVGESCGIGFARIIGNEISMTLQRAAGVCGDGIYVALGRHAIERERDRLGFCVTCSGSPARSEAWRVGDGTSSAMCASCLNKANAEDEAEATR